MLSEVLAPKPFCTPRLHFSYAGALVFGSVYVAPGHSPRGPICEGTVGQAPPPVLNVVRKPEFAERASAKRLVDACGERLSNSDVNELNNGEFCEMLSATKPGKMS